MQLLSKSFSKLKNPFDWEFLGACIGAQFQCRQDLVYFWLVELALAGTDNDTPKKFTPMKKEGTDEFMIKSDIGDATAFL